MTRYKYIQSEAENKDIFVACLDQAISLDFTRVSFSRKLLAKKIPVYTYPQFRLLLPLTGNHSYKTLGEDKFEEVFLAPGKALFVQPDGVSVSKNCRSEEPVEILGISFWPDFVRFVVSRHGESLDEWVQVWYHSHSAIDRFGIYVLKALDELVHEPDSNTRACLMVKALLYTCRKHLLADKARAVTKSYRTYQNIMAYLYDNFNKDINRETVANDFAISPSHISKLFAAYNKHNFNTVLKMLRLDHAEQLLKSTKFSVAEVAEHCGFVYSEYFIRIFKDFYGETPGNFRRKTTEK